MHKIKICIVLPCFKVKKQILSVYDNLKKLKIDKIIFVDDFCPQKSVKYLFSQIPNKEKNKIHCIYNRENTGVGGATLKGFNEAKKQGYDIVVKFDADNQHSIQDLVKIINRLKKRKIFYCKGYRPFLLNKNSYKNMPKIRIFGTLVLTYITRLITQNYQLKDVTNGLFGLKTIILNKLDTSNIKKNYFFEQDMIFHTCLNNIEIDQVKTNVIYSDEESSLSEFKIILPFIFYHFQNIFLKIFK